MDNLVDLVNVVTLRKKTTLVFIKKSPDEVAEILKAYPDLCSINVYRQKYWSSLPWNVTKNVRRSIFEQGFVTEKQVEYPKTDWYHSICNHGMKKSGRSNSPAKDIFVTFLKL